MASDGPELRCRALPAGAEQATGRAAAGSSRSTSVANPASESGSSARLNPATNGSIAYSALPCW